MSGFVCLSFLARVAPARFVVQVSLRRKACFRRVILAVGDGEKVQGTKLAQERQKTTAESQALTAEGAVLSFYGQGDYSISSFTGTPRIASSRDVNLEIQ